MSYVLKKIEKAFKSLMKKRSFFVSEADFQHSFAIELRDKFKGKKDAVYLEYPVEQDKKHAYIDIVLVHGKDMYPIELKYKTKKIETKKPVAKPAVKKTVAKPVTKPTTANWYVQLASYSTRALAEAGQRQMQNAHKVLRTWGHMIFSMTYTG